MRTFQLAATTVEVVTPVRRSPRCRCSNSSMESMPSVNESTRGTGSVARLTKTNPCQTSHATLHHDNESRSFSSAERSGLPIRRPCMEYVHASYGHVIPAFE